MTRPLFVAGNWKMNPKTLEEAVALAEGVRGAVGTEGRVHVAVCPPHVYLHAIDKVLEDTPVGLGAQNVYHKPEGAYTGEHSAAMLVDAGCTHVLLGHSERRHVLGETDHMVNEKLHAALEAGLLPIVCVGETRDEREQGRTEGVVGGQMLASLAGIPKERMTGIVIAYEPVWAIGTGLTASPEQAQEVHRYIRHLVSDRCDEAIAARVCILYGGSVKSGNARELMACRDIDGVLVGGASLQVAEFAGIIDAARTVSAEGK